MRRGRRSALEASLQSSCSQGYGGLRCGTCSDGYGSVAFDCRRCMSRALIVFLLLLNVVWFLFLCGVAIKGNLVKKDSEEETLRERIKQMSAMSEGLPSDVEMDTIGGTARHFLNPRRTESLTLLSDPVKYDLVRRNVAERLKVECLSLRMNG